MTPPDWSISHDETDIYPPNSSNSDLDQNKPPVHYTQHRVKPVLSSHSLFNNNQSMIDHHQTFTPQAINDSLFNPSLKEGVLIKSEDILTSNDTNHNQLVTFNNGGDMLQELQPHKGAVVDKPKEEIDERIGNKYQFLPPPSMDYDLNDLPIGTRFGDRRGNL